MVDTKDTTPPNNVFDLFAGKKGVKKVEKRVEKGEKVTTNEAFTAMTEMRSGLNLMWQSVQNLAEDIYKQFNALQYVKNYVYVVTELLERKGIFTSEELKTTWDELVMKPAQAAKEQELKDKVEELKKKSATDALFADTIEKVKAFTFPATTVENEELTAEDTKDMYLGGLMDDTTRSEVLEVLREKFPELGLLTPPEVASVAPEASNEATTPISECHPTDCECCKTPCETEPLPNNVVQLPATPANDSPIGG